MPAEKIRASDVAQFPAVDQSVKRIECFVDERLRIETAPVVEVDAVGPETAETGFTGLENVIPRRADVVWSCPQAKGGFGGDQNIPALAFDGFAENFFQESVRIDVRGIGKIDAMVKANPYQLFSFRDIGFSPRTKKCIPSAKSPGAKAEHGNFQAGISK